jgi:hypothetical protein
VQRYKKIGELANILERKIEMNRRKSQKDSRKSHMK